MKYLSILMILLIAFVGCTTEDSAKEQSSTVEPSETIIIGDESKEADSNVDPVREFNIRAVEKGFSPDVIEVNEGENVRLLIRNMNDEKSRVSFMEEEYVYSKGQTVTFEFVAELGTYEFGDESHSVPKGLVIVS